MEWKQAYYILESLDNMDIAVRPTHEEFRQTYLKEINRTKQQWFGVGVRESLQSTT